MSRDQAIPEPGPATQGHPQLTSLERDGMWLFLLSILALYLELLLIRWVGTEIRIFAYLQNTVLVVCFLGLGLGLFTAREPIRMGRGIWAIVILAALLAIPPTREILAGISVLLSTLGEMNIWGASSQDSAAATVASLTLGLLLALVVMLLIVEGFIPLGRLLGRLMDRHPRPIAAYSINVAGSLVGIWLFVLLSMLNQPPVAWFVCLALLALPLLVRRGSVAKGALMGLAVLVLTSWLADRDRDSLAIVWSPYQKLALFDAPERFAPAATHFVAVNNVKYQWMMDLRPETVGPAHLGQYDIPFLVHPRPTRALIVGAGTGNDVAGALRSGRVERVTAVEIDPAIVSFGLKHHRERPYQSERVDVVVDDARSFFARTSERYDLILFGLLDAHTSTAMTNARLDHYVYTRESFERARQLLRPGGMIVLVFEVRRQFIADRLAVVLREVFEEEPIAFRIPMSALGVGGVMLIAGNVEAAHSRIGGDERLAGMVADWKREHPLDLSYATPPTTDDWPYLYLERPTIPLLFVLLAGLLWLIVIYARRRLAAPAGTNPLRWPRSAWHFFFLGAAFLLLEVQNISKAAVVLGNTWVVNAVIISAVLCMILLANAIAAKWPRIPLGPVYGALIGSALALYFVDLARFAFLPFPTKALLVGVLTTLPMLFSGIVFVRSFKVAPRKDLALGANLYGALVGGLLQSISFLTGIKFLLLIVAAFYGLALLTRNVEPEVVTRRAPEPAGEQSVAGVTR